MNPSLQLDISVLQDMKACKDAIEWLTLQQSFVQAWRDCQRGDWMLWLLGRCFGKLGSPKHRKLVLAACGCARLALPYVPKGEERPRGAIETAEAWARRKRGVTLEQVRNAAYAAAYAANAANAAYAATAANAAYAATAANAANAAYAAATAANAAYAAAAKEKTLAKCADIVRKHFPKAPKVSGET